MISVAICTYNRARSLDATLRTLVAQADPGAPWELLVVDNRCTDDTRAVVESFRTKLPLRWATEPNQGLSHARNRALAEARGHVVLFTDDDVRLDPGWLRAYSAHALESGGAQYLAGRVLPDWGSGRPAWFRDETAQWFDGVVVRFDLGAETRELDAEDPQPFGASFGIRRSLFERLGPFRTDLGVRGRENGRGEETEYILRARHAGARGVYVADALCWHPVDRDRFRLGSLYRHGIAGGIAHQRIHQRQASGSIPRALLHLLRGGGQLLRGRGDRFRRCVINCGIEIGMRRASRGGAA